MSFFRYASGQIDKQTQIDRQARRWQYCVHLTGREVTTYDGRLAKIKEEEQE